MTKEEEKKIFASPATRRLVFDVINMAQGKDCVDAYYDVLLAAEILKSHMDRALGDDS